MAGPGMLEYLSKYHKTEILVEDGVLVKCDTLETEVTLPEGIRAIGDYAFSDCLRLRSIRIPESVTHMGQCPFRGCRNLTGIHIPAHLLEGMTAISAIGLFSDNIMNQPFQERRFLVPILEGTDDYSEGFRNLFVQRLQQPGHGAFWLYRSIEEKNARWARTILELNQTLRDGDLDECIRMAAETGNAEIGSMLIAYSQARRSSPEQTLLL